MIIRDTATRAPSRRTVMVCGGMVDTTYSIVVEAGATIDRRGRVVSMAMRSAPTRLITRYYLPRQFLFEVNVKMKLRAEIN